MKKGLKAENDLTKSLKTGAKNPDNMGSDQTTRVWNLDSSGVFPLEIPLSIPYSFS